MDQGRTDVYGSLLCVAVQRSGNVTLASQLSRSDAQAVVFYASCRWLLWCLLGLVCAVVLTKPFAPTSDTSTVQRERVASDLERVRFDQDVAVQSGFVEFEVRPTDVSVHVQFSALDPRAYVLITGIQGPDDEWIYRNGGSADDDEEGPVTSAFTDSIYGQYGDAAVFMPMVPLQPLKPGRYRVLFDTQADARLRNSAALFKSSERPIDESLQLLDINLWVAHTDAAWLEELADQRLDGAYRQTLEGILQPHDLTVGELSLYRASNEQIAEFALIDEYDDAQIQSACRAMLSGVENERALNVVMVETLYADEGGSAGFSSVPGPLFDTSAANGCVFMGETAYITDAAEGLDQAMVDELHAVTMLHEGGHFMSLEHPSESDGRSFDYLSDTPECDIQSHDGRIDEWTGEQGEIDGEISDYECGTAGGADNVLFYSGVIEYAPFKLSRQQAWVLRRHPLFRPRTPADSH